MKRKLTPELIQSFSEMFLVKNYDGSLDVPEVHKEWWEMCLARRKFVAIAAPRGHAKTTAISNAYAMANLLFRKKRYVIIIGNTEETAAEIVSNIRTELQENEDLREVFGIEKLIKDGSTEIIVRCEDGHQFRVLAKGSGQKIRGRMWRGTRPDLIVVDDLEDDEQVDSDDRRRKLKNWMMKTVQPALSKRSGQIRMIGTILHEDSFLMNAIKSKAWLSKLYKAHDSFDCFDNILWPEMWSEEDLKEVRQSYIDMGDPEGYAQEYLNDPSDIRNAFFRVDDMLPMTDVDRNKLKTYYVGVDFAFSDKSWSDYTVMVIGGYDEDGVLHIVDERRLRTEDFNVILEELFSVMARWSPEYFIWEKGTLDNWIRPPFLEEMGRRNQFALVETFPATQDKRLRAASIQQRMRAGAVRYDTEAEWFMAHREEVRKFPKGEKKDRVDALAWLGRAIDEFAEAPTEQELEDAEWEMGLSDMDDYDYTGTGY